MTSAPVVNTSSDFGSHVANRLERDFVIWLTTVGPTGTPQPNPVWFLWDGTEFLLFSKPDQAKLRNIAHNPRVALNLNSTPGGSEIAILTGTARLPEEAATADEIAAYTKKYASGMTDIGLTVEQFYADYSVPIRITPDRLRGF
ncbi:TIGR03667 family PPOX class F420-dependent oxidoreductase [Nocardia sp. NPDC020380]|uniref:TIGR03667 family PPOX class F420-dependent oxidoreductase n=1 Tax=Nocardia sp. NPDC020380 TaxID=3364309 RepID=UPI0037AF5FED